MPPEPLPWDRKELFFKDRKHERGPSSDALAAAAPGGNSAPRWRDPYHFPRDFPRASPRRPPPSHYRQNGGYHQLYEESNGHGCTPSRSSERFWVEEESFRSPSGRYNGGRSNSRESRGSFRRSPYHDSQEPHMTSQKLVAVPITSSPPLKDSNDKNGGDDQRSDRDPSLGSIGWKSLKWSRQGSISSAKTVKSELEEVGLEVSVLPLGKETPVRSPMSSPLPSDDGIPRKKPRLGWGQGLAKYEKQKVEGSANSGKDQISETSPKVMGLAGSLSPATPCSAACSSSPAGMEDRPFTKATNFDNDRSHSSDSFALVPQHCSGELSIKLDHLPPISSLTSMLTDLLQPEDACFGDSAYTKNTATDRLLLFKADISKELEKTECEIDLFESELKSLNCDGKSDYCQSSFTLQSDSASVSSLESADGSLKVSLNSTHHVISSAMTVVGEPVLQTCSSDEHDAEVKDADSDTPLAGSSDIGKSTFSTKKISDIDKLNSVGCAVIFENDRFQVPETQHSTPLDVGEKAVTENGSRDQNHLDAGSSSANANLDVSSHGKTDDKLIDLIMSSNRDAAKRASQVFDKSLSTAPPQFDIWGLDRILSHRKNDMHIKEKLAFYKRQLKFKERVLTLKFRAFHHLWKEDLRLLSVRKQRPKSQKRFELSSRPLQSGSQKHRSSIRSRFTLPAGNLTLVPTADIVDFTSKLLSDSQIKLYRNNLKMPALILDEKERRCSRFIANNSLIEDPPSFEKERAMINPWTVEEKRVFMEMLATFGKDFAKISSFLNHKTTADCIEFYYKYHKSESFGDVKKHLNLRKQWQCSATNTYLVTSGKKWNREANAASLDILGAVSVAAALNNDNTRNPHKYAGRSVLPSYHNSKVSRGSNGSLERVNSVEISGYEKEAAAADVLAGICGALSSEAVSSCVTSSISPPEKMNYTMMDRPLTPEVTQTIEEEDTCSDEGSGEMDPVDWTDEEKSIFIRALSMYGKDFAKISCCVGTKSRDQCKIFFSKARKCLSLDLIHPEVGNGGTPMSDTNGDTDDACAAEMDSAICSTQSCSKMDVDFTQSVAKTSSEGFVHAGNTSLQTETDPSSEQYEVGGSNQEEFEGKVGLESVLNVKLETEGENPRSDKTLEEMGDASLKCNELARSHDGAELSVDREARKVDNGLVVSPVEPATTTCIAGEQLKPQTAAEVQQKVITRGITSADELKSEVDSQHFLLMSETESRDRQRKKIGTDKSNGISLSFATDSNANGNASHTAIKMNACSNPSFNFATSYQRRMPQKLLPCLQQKSRIMSMKQDNTHSVPLSTVLPDPSSICSEGSLRVPSQSTLNFEEHPNKQHQCSAARDFYHQYYQLRNQTLNQIDQSLHVLSGYPLRALNEKELKRDANLIREKPILLESHSKENVSSQMNQYSVPDIHNEKSNGLAVSNSSPGILFPPRSEDPSDSQLRPCSQNACQETDQHSTHRTGDVKLFGQILSNPSSLQKSNSSSEESDNQPLSPKQKNSASMKPSTSGKDGSSCIFPSKSGSGGRLDLEEVPLRSYGFWDGNRIRTGFSSLPESAVMLSKYQGSVAGMPFYSAEDSGVSSTNGVLTDYQQAYVQPLSADGKRLDSFSELQKRNGFEMVSGYQQGRTAVVRLGVNLAGGSRGILVGGGGVSDPVTALKMHYTTTGRAKFLSSEVESWRGDLGGR